MIEDVFFLNKITSKLINERKISQKTKNILNKSHHVTQYLYIQEPDRLHHILSSQSVHYKKKFIPI